MPCLCAIAGAIPPDYVDATYSSHTEKKASVDAEGNFDPKPVETTKWARRWTFKSCVKIVYSDLQNKTAYMI